MIRDHELSLSHIRCAVITRVVTQLTLYGLTLRIQTILLSLYFISFNEELGLVTERALPLNLCLCDIQLRFSRNLED